MRRAVVRVSARRFSALPTDAQKVLVEESWKSVEKLGLETVGVLLFKNVFEAAPEALQLFSFRDEPNLYESSIMKWHGSNVVKHVGVAVGGLRDLDNLVPALEALGAKHNNRDILPVHFDVVGAAMLKTLEMGLGDQFTPEVREAWATTYGTVANVMMSKMPECQTK